MAKILIDALLRLNTQDAENQLKKAVSKKQEPIAIPIAADIKEAQLQIEKLKDAASNWKIDPKVTKSKLDALHKEIDELHLRSQVKLRVDSDMSQLRDLKRNIDSIQSELSVKVQNEVKKIEVAVNGSQSSTGSSNTYEQKAREELVKQSKDQIELLSKIVDEQRDTQRTIKQESGTRLINVAKQKVFESTIGSTARSFVKTFGVDVNYLEKSLDRILPSFNIISADLRDMAGKLNEATGTGKRFKKFIDDIAGSFADATAGANSIEEIGVRFKDSAKKDFDIFRADLKKTAQDFKDFSVVLRSMGIDLGALEYSVLSTKTGSSVAKGLSRTLDKPLADRKNRIQDERLGIVLQRAKDLVERDIKNPKKSTGSLAKNALGAVDESLEELLLVIGGYATKASSGIGRAEEINTQLKEIGQGERKKAVGLLNPDIYRPKGLGIKQAFPLAVLRPNLRGYSKDAEEMAAQAIAALNKNSKIKVKLVGESGGGFAVEEAIQILNKLGYGDRVSGRGYGTPSLNAKASRSSNYDAVLGTNKAEALGYEVQNLFTKLGIVAPEASRVNPKVSQDLKGLDGHPIDNYYKLDEFRSFVLGTKDGVRQSRASLEDIKKLRSHIASMVISGSSKEAIQLVDKFEDNTRVSGKSTAPFNQLKSDISKLVDDVNSGVIEELAAIKQSLKNVSKDIDIRHFEGDVGFFKDLTADISQVRLILKKFGLNSSKITEDVIDDINRDLNQLVNSIPNLKNPELLKGDYVRKKVDGILNTLSSADPKDAIASITEIEPVLKEYLAKVRALDDSDDKTKIQGALEGQLKTIKAAKKLALLAVEFDFGELVENPPQYLKIIRDSSLEKAKESAKKKSLSAAQAIALKTKDAVDDIVDGLQDRLLEAIEIVKSKALGGTASNIPLLKGSKDGAIAKTGQSGIIKSSLTDTGQVVLARAIADLISSGKASYGVLSRLEQTVFDILPILRATKGITQVAAPVIGGAAIASQSPEIAALAKLSAHELANVIEPLIMASRSVLASAAGSAVSNLPGIGGGAKVLVEQLINNPAFNNQVAGGAGAITAYGALGGGAGAIAKAGTKLAGKKVYAALPQGVRDQLTPDAIAAFDQLIAVRQSEIKQLASGLNKQIAVLKSSNSQESSQKLLSGYHQLNTEIKELEVAVSSTSKSSLQQTRDRITELKGIQKGLSRAIKKIGDGSKEAVSAMSNEIFGIKIDSVDNSEVNKNTLKIAIADYKNEIIKYRKNLEKKILNKTVVDSDYKAGEYLASRGIALGNELKQKRGFSKESKALKRVSVTLQSKIPKNVATDVGEDVVNGILQGSNEKLSAVFIQGRKLGVELLDGFKKELGIQSPSKEFAKEVRNISSGLDVGLKNESARIKRTGADIAQNLIDASNAQLQNYKPRLKNLAKNGLQDIGVNGLGLVANKAASIATGGFPGAGLAAEFVVSVAARKGINDLKATFKALDKVLAEGSSDTDTKLKLINKVVKQSIAEAKSQSLKTKASLDKDAAGFAIGNISAEVSHLAGANIPLIGGVVAIATTDQAIKIRNQIIKAVDSDLIVTQVTRGLVKGVARNAAIVTSQGKQLGDSLLGGFKVRLGIKSPSLEFERGMSDVAKGIVGGAVKERDRIKATGKDIGKTLFDASKLGLGDYDDLVHDLERSLAKIRSLKKTAYQQAFNKPDSDISGYLKEIERLKDDAKITARKIAAFRDADTRKPYAPRQKPSANTGSDLPRNATRRWENDLSRDRLAFDDRYPNALNKLNKVLESVGINAGKTRKILASLATVAFGGFFIGDIKGFLVDAGRLVVKFEQLETRMKFTAGDTEAGEKAVAFAKSEAMRLKIDVEGALSNYSAILNATKSSPILKNKSEEIFSVINQASKVSGGSNEQTQAAATAIQQMISGGTVQLEELRQLGESGGIANVFGTAADSLKLTQMEMKKLISTGTLATDDFLPKFITQLDRVTRLGVDGAIRTLDSALTNLNSEFKLFKIALFEDNMSPLIGATNALSGAIALVRDNLNIVFPVLKGVTVLTVTALLPTVLMLGKTALSFLVKGLWQVVTALLATQAPLTSTNMQLTLIASLPPKVARLIPVINSLSVAIKAMGYAFGAVIAVMVVEKTIGAFISLKNQGQEARDAVKGIEQSVIDLDKALSDIKGKELPDDLINLIADKNKQKVQDDLNWLQKGIDSVIQTGENLDNAMGLGKYGELDTNASTAMSRISAASGEAIAANQKALQQMKDDIGATDITEIGTKALDAYVKSLDTRNDYLSNAANNEVDPSKIRGIQAELAANDNQIDAYNRELERRQGLELNLAKIVLTKEKSVTNASRAEVTAIATIDEQILKSGDYKKDVELQKLSYTKTRIDSELAAEKVALAQIKSLAESQGKIDSDTGEMTDSKQIEEYKKSEDKIIELTKASIETRQSILAKETDQKIAEYDRYVKAIEDKAKVYKSESVQAEKERLIEMQSLYNDDLISQQQLDDFKTESSRVRILEDIELEEDRLSKLTKFKSDEKSVQEQNNSAIAESRNNLLDMTLQLLEQEKEAEEKVIEHISQLRDNAYSALEARLSRLQTLYQNQEELRAGRSEASQKFAELELGVLRKGLDLRQQLNSAELDPADRKIILSELTSLGIKGKTDELSILNQIAEKEDAIAKSKIESLQKQQYAAQKQFELEIMSLELATRKSVLDSKKTQNEAQKEMLNAESAILDADSPQELKAAQEGYELAKLSLDLANEQASAAKTELDNLGSTVKLKREILELNQANERIELGISNQDSRFAIARERKEAKESGARRRSEFNPQLSLNQYLSRQESVDNGVDQRRKIVEKSGKEFTSEMESSVRTQLNLNYLRSQNARDNANLKSLLGQHGFSATSQPSIIDALRLGNRFAIPNIEKTVLPPKTANIGATSGSLDSNGSITSILRSIESKFAQPTVINVKNDNNFVNQYERAGADKALEKIRSELVDGLNAIAGNS